MVYLERADGTLVGSFKTPKAARQFAEREGLAGCNLRTGFELRMALIRNSLEQINELTKLKKLAEKAEEKEPEWKPGKRRLREKTGG